MKGKKRRAVGRVGRRRKRRRVFVSEMRFMVVSELWLDEAVVLDDRA